MNPLLVAGLWLSAGLLFAVLRMRVGGARLAALLPAVPAIGVAILVQRDGVAAAHGPLGVAVGLSLDRGSVGLIALSAVALAMALLLSGPGHGHELAATALTGAAATIMLSANTMLVWGCAATLAVLAFGLRWVVTAPGRTTLAACRVAGVGAVAAMAVAPFFPIPASSAPSWGELVAWLLTLAVGVLLGLVPLGGWAVAGLRSVRGCDAALWLLLVVPAVLFAVPQIRSGLPVGVGPIFGVSIGVAGLVSALWQVGQGVLGPVSERYLRIVLADIGLAAAAGALNPLSGPGQSGSGAGPGLEGMLLLVLAHLMAAPVLLQGSVAAGGAPGRLARLARRCAWLGISGLPPSLGFWARLLIVAGCSGASNAALYAAALAAVAISTVATVAGLSNAPTNAGESLASTAPSRRSLLSTAVGFAAPRWSGAVAMGWAILALGLGLAPGLAVQAVFGGWST